MSDLISAMAWKYPGIEFGCGETYESLIWNDASQKPTKSDVDQVLIDYSIYKANTEYRVNRLMEYPEIAELVVALWEMLIESRPESAQAIQILRAQIKQKHPKP